MNAYALTTAARAKLYLGITTSADDNLIERLIDAISDSIEKYCERRFKQTAYSNELYDGSGGSDMVLKNYPVISSETFTLEERSGSDNINSFSTISGNLYFVKYDRGIVALSGSTFIKATQRYRVSYTAGYNFDNTTPGATLESVGLGDLEEAVWRLVGNSYRDRHTSDAIESESIGNYSVTFRREIAMAADIKAVLDRYKRPAMIL